MDVSLGDTTSSSALPEDRRNVYTLREFHGDLRACRGYMDVLYFRMSEFDKRMVRIEDSLERLVRLQTGEKKFPETTFVEGDICSDPGVPCQWRYTFSKGDPVFVLREPEIRGIVTGETTTVVHFLDVKGPMGPITHSRPKEDCRLVPDNYILCGVANNAKTDQFVYFDEI